MLPFSCNLANYFQHELTQRNDLLQSSVAKASVRYFLAVKHSTRSLKLFFYRILPNLITQSAHGTSSQITTPHVSFSRWIPDGQWDVILSAQWFTITFSFIPPWQYSANSPQSRDVLFIKLWTAAQTNGILASCELTNKRSFNRPAAKWRSHLLLGTTWMSFKYLYTVLNVKLMGVESLFSLRSQDCSQAVLKGTTTPCSCYRHRHQQKQERYSGTRIPLSIFSSFFLLESPAEIPHPQPLHCRLKK